MSAVLKRATRIDHGYGLIQYTGEIYGDSAGRWSDGTWIGTSKVVEETHPTPSVTRVETLNTGYFLNTKAVHLRRAARLIQKTGVARSFHVVVNSDDSECYCINGALIMTDPDAEQYVRESVGDTGFSLTGPKSDGVNYTDSEIQKAIGTAIGSLYPDAESAVGWVFNDSLMEEIKHEARGIISNVLYRAADVIDGLPF